ncbi:NAD(P)-dependent oxidoreductase [Campylobacter volucris]|uniref:NAD(P)-dependent oxidoreductase n=1 Tax=Campylobacter volucris TaxID=1031542 RepID=A0AAE5YJA0_9BACT|nr:NAD(P)-dependent oxidoreductase [Campylobacter volucris]AJC93647.1 nucleoside-diphosphate-sugar epimerase [Campylobacter volucris LMG 24379]KAB0579872.1 NAD(P)-dependent oxidoreductase [Campylobacter volucris]QBL13969.1 nucleoside-diphosphate sugar epimerase [Campylobacter volucris]QEL07860.1 nucleoside-diphosphate-sugar epimerase [Campylobacter volucris]TXK70796.1 NAD(P)-dependent oxidoreductase [Campylobacter volucris]
MKNAIVFGATGYIGKALVEKLLSQNIKVLAIGRRNQYIQHTNLKYVYIDTILEVFFEQLMVMKNDFKDAVFYNVAWSGLDRLTNGEIQDQVKNIAMSSKAIQFASKLGCSKFINIGSQEEAIFNDFISSEKWKTTTYTSSPIYYAGAKFANMEMLKLLAYLEKIDFINTRFSIVIDKTLSGVSFVAKNLKSIVDGEIPQEVRNTQPCEIIFFDELIESYYQIGKFGKNKADYYLGIGKVDVLANYLSSFYEYKTNSKEYIQSKLNFDKKLLDTFDPSSLCKDTNFYFKKDFSQIMREILE